MRHSRMGSTAKIVGRWLLVMLLVLMVPIGSLAGGTAADAHASLLEALPAADSELSSPPKQVVLTFNERLEESLYSLRVLDRNKKSVTDRPPVMSQNRMQLSLELPPLNPGTYVVTYRVISADGHPVEGTYVFASGTSLDKPSVGAAPQLEHTHRQEGAPFQSSGWKDQLTYAVRILYYFILLSFTGWLLWLRWLPKDVSASGKERLQGIGTRLQQAYLLVFIVFMWVHLFALIGDGGREALLSLFTRTSIGPAWLGGLILALVSFLMLHRSSVLDYIWVALAWFCKALLGHAAAFEPVGETLTLDWLHLASASIWTGGLLMLLFLWRYSRDDAKRLYPSFSAVALLSILLLAVSGVLSVFLFLPDVRYVVETGWGQFVIAKTVLVLAVVMTAFLIRRGIRKGDERSPGVLMMADGVLMSLIVVIVGIFTYLSPLPPNKPLQWHVMGERIHMTTQITPNAPGVNDFTVKVWLPEELGKPKQVILKLQERNSSKEIAPLMVPLQPVEDTSADESYGMPKHTYKARGPYLPYPGHWKVEVRVMDREDNETVYEQEMRVY